MVRSAGGSVTGAFFLYFRCRDRDFRGKLARMGSSNATVFDIKQVVLNSVITTRSLSRRPRKR